MQLPGGSSGTEPEVPVQLDPERVRLPSSSAMKSRVGDLVRLGIREAKVPVPS